MLATRPHTGTPLRLIHSKRTSDTRGEKRSALQGIEHRKGLAFSSFWPRGPTLCLSGAAPWAEFGPLWLTSIRKRIDVVVEEAMRRVVEGTFQGGVYVGTLENGGVDIAPFHELNGRVPRP